MLITASSSDRQEPEGSSSEPENSNPYPGPSCSNAWEITKKRKVLTSKRSPSPNDYLSNVSEAQPSEQEETFSSSQCLFCNLESASLEINLAHMSLRHGFFIPNAECLIDTSSLLGYLFVIISRFHECLLCGSTKITKLAVQDHMRGKSHCRVDFEDEKHQLWQFYDFSGEAGSDGGNKEEDEEEEEAEEKGAEKITLIPDENELRLPSGKILGHRAHRMHLYRNRLPAADPSLVFSPDPQQQLPRTPSFETPPIIPNDWRIAMRANTSMSMIGVPELEQRALMAVERKIEKVETRARNEYFAKVESGGNKQKRFRVLTMGKKAGGLEKRCG